MDLSKLSDEDLAAVASGDMSKVSDQGLELISTQEKSGNDKSGVNKLKEEGLIAPNSLISTSIKALEVAKGVSRAAVAAGLQRQLRGASALGSAIMNPIDTIKGENTYNPEETINFSNLNEDMSKAVRGEGPSSIEYMQKAGVPNTLAYPVGFVADIAIDPLAALGSELSSVARGGNVLSSKLLQKLKLANSGGLTKAGKFADIVLNPLEVASQKTIGKAGEKIYKSGFEKVDRAIDTQEGKGSIADLFWKERFRGNMDDATKRAQEMNQEFGSKLGTIRENIAEKGAIEAPKNIISTEDAARAQKIIDDLRVNPEPAYQVEAEKLQNILNDYLDVGEKNIQDIATVKGQLKRDAGGNAMFKMMREPVKNEEDKLKLLLSSIYNKAENAAASKALTPQELADYIDTKKNYGITSSFAQKKLSQEALKEANRTGIAPSAVDTMGWGAAAASSNPMAMAGMAAKKARDIGRLTATKTNLGVILHDTAPKVTSPLTREVLWLKMLENEKKNNKE